FPRELRVKEMSAELRIVNIFNDQGTRKSVQLLPAILPDRYHAGSPSWLVIGDFNLHHSVGGGEGAEKDAEADELLDVLEVAGLDNRLPQGAVTRERGGNKTTIDLVLASRNLRERIINCGTDVKVHADSDHLPIHTLLDIHTSLEEEPVPEDDHQVYAALRNRKSRVIGRTLKTGFRNWVKSATEQGPRGLWKVSKWARNRDQSSGSSMIPQLKMPGSSASPAKSNLEKVNELISLSELIRYSPILLYWTSDVSEEGGGGWQHLPQFALT
ncbi:hypothetical protein N7532_007004, partial [Penicillium argentinense]